MTKMSCPSLEDMSKTNNFLGYVAVNLGIYEN